MQHNNLHADIINKIKSEINKKISNNFGTFPQFPDSSYIPFPISEKNFHEIYEEIFDGKIAFIDGGNQELVKTPDLSLSLIRTYCAIYKTNTKIFSRRAQFYALTTTKEINKEIFYATEIYSTDNIVPDKNDLIFNSFDETIKTGSNRIDISKIGGIVRRFAELNTAIFLSSMLKKNDLLILDGSLLSSITNENKYMEKLFSISREKNITISALSKTNSLLTDNGNSFIGALDRFNKKGIWYYYPIADIKNENHKADLYFIKLHQLSKYIFLFEIYKESFCEKNKLFCALAKISSDPVFFGYPYPLIESDRLARISNYEQRIYSTELMSLFGKDWKKLKPSINSKNAHDILDSISSL